MIAIAGASASGKTYIAKALHDQLAIQFGEDSVESLSEDSYYNHTPDLSLEERAQINFDHPDAFEHSLMVSHINQLKQGESIAQPQYCFKTHLRLQQTIIKKPAKWLILDGLHLFHRNEISAMYDLKVYIETPIEVCLKRRITRDQEQRQRTLESIINQFETTVKPMFLEFIDPAKTAADIILDGTNKVKKNIDIISHMLAENSG